MNMFAQMCAQVVAQASVSLAERYTLEQKQIDAMVREDTEEKEDAAKSNLQVEVL
jgi:hypothetical protein